MTRRKSIYKRIEAGEVVPNFLNPSSKLKIIDGKYFRMRRGKLVEIPSKWVGKTTHDQTIRKRQSKRGQGASFKAKAVR